MGAGSPVQEAHARTIGHIFLVVGETRVPGGNLRRHGENMQTPLRKALVRPGFEPRTFLLRGESAIHSATVPQLYEDKHLNRACEVSKHVSWKPHCVSLCHKHSLISQNTEVAFGQKERGNVCRAKTNRRSVTHNRINTHL
ncbi:unnamed protein product [Knipowitschia caucasica]